jgi:hypothetical protein
MVVWRKGDGDGSKSVEKQMAMVSSQDDIKKPKFIRMSTLPESLQSNGNRPKWESQTAHTKKEANAEQPSKWVRTPDRRIQRRTFHAMTHWVACFGLSRI